MPAITITDLENAKTDVDHIADLANSQNLTAIDRLGTEKKTLAGVLASIGYEAPITYAGGISFTASDATKTVDESGVIYAPFPSALPFTTSGTFVGDDDARFYPIQFSISDTPQKVDDITGLLSEGTYNNEIRIPIGYHPSSDKGGGPFYWDASLARSNHNGGTIISPTCTWDGTQADLADFLDGTNETSGGSNGCWVRIYDREVNIKWFGVVGDGVTDDTNAVQTALYSAGDGNPSSGIIPTKDELHIVVPKGTYLLTDRVHQPSHVQVVGSSGVDLNPNSGWDSSTPDANVIFQCSFGTTSQSAWVISGYARNGKSGLLDSDYIDPYQVGTTDAEYDNGDVTRAIRVKLDGVHFRTTDYIASAVSVSAAPNAIIRYSSYGFLHTGCFYACWTLDLSLYGLSYHSGGFLYTPNGVTLKGYTSRFTTDTSPTTVETSKPFGWQTTSTFSYTGSDRYMSTGLYMAFVNGADISAFTSEKFDRGRLYWNCYGIHESSPYCEKLNTVAFHNINSSVVISAPFFNDVPAVSRTGGGSTNGSTTIEGYRDYGSIPVGSVNESGGPVTLVRTSNNGRVEATEPYKDSIFWEFYDSQFEYINISSSGSDANTGLSAANSVLTVETAIDRAKHYGYNRVKIADGETVNSSTANKVLDFDLEFFSDAGSEINFNVSSGSIRSIRISRATLKIDNVDITVPASSVSGEQAAFKLLGPCSTDFLFSTTTVDTTSALFTTVANTGAVADFVFNGGALTADNLSLDDASSSGEVKIIPVIGSSVTTTGTLTWSSNFTVI